MIYSIGDIMSKTDNNIEELKTIKKPKKGESVNSESSSTSSNNVFTIGLTLLGLPMYNHGR